MTIKDKPTEEFHKFDKAMDKIMSVSKAELDKRLAAAKKAKTGKVELGEVFAIEGVQESF